MSKCTSLPLTGEDGTQSLSPKTLYQVLVSGLLHLLLGIQVESSQYQLGITHVAVVMSGRLGQQEDLRSMFYVDLEEFCQCNVVRLLRELTRILDGNFLVLKASFDCGNVVPSLHNDHQVVLWRMRQKDFHSAGFSSKLSVFFKHQLKVKNKMEKVRLSSSEFCERWLRVLHLMREREGGLLGGT